MRILAIILVLLTACSESGVKERARREPPAFQYKTRQINGNELITIDMGDYQRCYVWRDQELKTAFMQCPSDSITELPNTGSMETTPRY